MNQNVIILLKGDLSEVWGSLVEICDKKEFSHNYLKKKKYPFLYRGITFVRVGFRTDNGIVGDTKEKLLDNSRNLIEGDPEEVQQ